jgi:hypothetical protein
MSHFIHLISFAYLTLNFDDIVIRQLAARVYQFALAGSLRLGYPLDGPSMSHATICALLRCTMLGTEKWSSTADFSRHFYRMRPSHFLSLVARQQFGASVAPWAAAVA